MTNYLTVAQFRQDYRTMQAVEESGSLVDDIKSLTTTELQALLDGSTKLQALLDSFERA